jgi:hypothetical protein
VSLSPILDKTGHESRRSAAQLGTGAPQIFDTLGVKAAATRYPYMGHDSPESALADLLIDPRVPRDGHATRFTL